MSKVVITGNASGTGDFTIAAPNSNTDRTLTLPDEAGTVLTTAGVPASAISDNSITSAKLTGDAVPIGVGQTWQNVTGSRAINTTYTNSTGKPIEVVVVCKNTTANTPWRIILSINGAGTVYYSAVPGGVNNGYFLTATAVIPDNNTYSISLASANYNAWWELR